MIPTLKMLLQETAFMITLTFLVIKTYYLVHLHFKILMSADGRSQRRNRKNDNST